MAYARGRTIASAGNMFGEYTVDSGVSGAAPEGQPTMIRTQGIPTGPGYRDRPSKWNFGGLVDRLRRLRSKPLTIEV